MSPLPPSVIPVRPISKAPTTSWPVITSTSPTTPMIIAAQINTQPHAGKATALGRNRY